MSTWRDGRFRLFISHSSIDKVAVTNVAAALERCAIDAFVAHVDIEPTADWQRTIDDALRTCEAMLAYVTTDFRASAWTGQEVGYALQREVLIVSARVSADPFGFLGREQALLAGSLSEKELADAVFEILLKNPKTAAIWSASVARGLVAAGSYAAVGVLLALAERAVAWSPEGIESLARAKAENSQVSSASFGRYPERIQQIIDANP